MASSIDGDRRAQAIDQCAAHVHTARTHMALELSSSPVPATPAQLWISPLAQSATHLPTLEVHIRLEDLSS
eukprot:CAMPEP_0115833334 /NCGR_PEP_ID=MMETSP0287-20121206/3121_1 /TAXON_ID=412157 /ORGANISM="Chrysochromulina rotalis, Strain UIO044" /LENGTH=70 /DNA_ID=CAMNT_0003286749 /DNA_START=162 /DNA_END=370 /DNA_ORIENTATION=+